MAMQTTLNRTGLFGNLNLQGFKKNKSTWKQTNPYYVNPAAAVKDPREGQAQLVRNQWKLFEDRYKPLEEEAAGLIMRDIEPEVTRAGQVAADAADRTVGMQQRFANRYGLNTRPQTQEQIDRSNSLQKALDIAQTKNNYRRSWDDERLNKLGELIGIGKGVAGSANQALGDAASMANQRAMAGEQAKQAKDAQQAQMRSSILGAGLAAALTFI